MKDFKEFAESQTAKNSFIIVNLIGTNNNVSGYTISNFPKMKKYVKKLNSNVL